MTQQVLMYEKTCYPYNWRNSILGAGELTCKSLHIPPLFLKWSESFHIRGILRSDKLITALHGSWVPSVSNL